MEARAVIASPPAGVDVTLIHESKTNPRRIFDEAKLAELADSIAKHGVMQPVLLRPFPKKSGHFELVAGARRLRASIKAGLAETPATVRELTDVEVLELQLIENLQRDDLDALAEAEGYQRLVKTGKYDVGTIASRIGKSPAYVYDRLKLAELVPDAKKLLERGLIGMGHAILLSRLSPQDQQKAIDPEGEGNRGPLFRPEYTIFDRDDLSFQEEEELRKSDPWHGMKARTVRELDSWIHDHVRFKADLPVNADLFPETVEALALARQEKEKVVEITKNYMLNDDTREKDGPRVYGERSWKRADGGEDSKTCDRSLLGIVVVGPGRGKSFRVCIDKKGCKVHWAKEQKEAERQAKARARHAAGEIGSDTGKGGVDHHAKMKAEQAERERKDKAWESAVPEIRTGLVKGILKAKITPNHHAAKSLLSLIADQGFGLAEKVAKLIPIGKTSESLLRHLVAIDVLGQAEEPWDPDAFQKVAKSLGVDVKKILAAHAAPVACRKCGCTEEKACAGGCSWAEPGLCTKCAPKTAKKSSKKGSRK